MAFYQDNKRSAVVLASFRPQRDRWRRVLENMGYATYRFEHVANCLDNFTRISPEVAVINLGRAESVYRFVYATQLIGRNIALVIVTDNREIKNFVKAEITMPLSVVSNESGSDSSAVCRMAKGGGKTHLGDGCPVVVGISPEVIRIKQSIYKLAFRKDPIMITGEAGTGKAHLARSIHKLSGAAIEDMMITGPGGDGKEGLAIEEPGKYVEAERGDGAHVRRGGGRTLFIRHLETYSSRAQARLFRIVEAMGGGSGGPGRRIITASTPVLHDMVRRGRFRRDLYYRLNGFSIHVPPLRDRVCDIPLLFAFFSDQLSIRLNLGFRNLFDTSMETLTDYPWPENVTELKRFTAHYFTTGSGNSPDTNQANRPHSSADRSLISFRAQAHPHIMDPGLDFLKKISLKEVGRLVAEQTETRMLTAALEKTGGNRTRAAALLGISYKAFLYKTKAYGIGWKKGGSAPDAGTGESI